MNLTKRFFLCLMLCALFLTGCNRNEETAPTVPKWPWAQKKATALTLVVTEEDFETIEKCENLRYLDVSGSTCYDAIMRYARNHPQVDVRYAAAVGSVTVKNTETELTLAPLDATLAILQESLPRLPQLKNIMLKSTCLTEQQLETLKQEFPDRDFRWTLDILGTEYPQDAESVNLASMDAADLDAVTAQVARLKSVTAINLSGSSLSPAEVKTMMDLFPEARIHYSFSLFGTEVSTETDRVDLTDTPIGNEGADTIRQALSIMPQCTYMKLENCGMSNEVLGGIQADFPNTKIVWRISFGGQYSLLTDETTLRTVYGVDNSHNEYLKYCTSLKYIDMGHNETLSDISFASYMPDLEILILSGAPIKNVDPLANCKNLVFLEMANCVYLEDISALRNCEKLRFLNIGFSRVTDISPIWDLPLERFVCLGPRMDWETRKAYEEEHPDCWARFSGENPLSLGWKYDDIGITYSEYYKFIREIFDLDSVDKRLAQQRAEEEARKEAEEQAKQEATTPPATEPAPTDPPATDPPATDPPAADPAPEG